MGDDDDSVFTVGGGVSMAGFNGVEASGSGPCKMVASLKFGATLMGFREVESTVTVVGSPILVGKLTSGRLVFISSGLFLAGGGVYVFNCCLKFRYLFCS